MRRQLFLAALLVVATRAGAVEATDIVGTWNVTSTVEYSTCPDNAEGEIFANIWTVSARPNALTEVTRDWDVNVAVQGKTLFPELEGFGGGSGLRVSGPAQSGYIRPMTTFELRPEGDGRLTGQRTSTATFNVQGVNYTCFVRFNVEAKR